LIEQYIMPDSPTATVVAAFHHALAGYIAHQTRLCGRSSLRWLVQMRTCSLGSQDRLRIRIGQLYPTNCQLTNMGRSRRNQRPNALGVKAAVEYSATRLTFKRAIIEPLRDNDTIRIVTAHGTFEMTRADFYDAFPKVVRSRSYREGGNYNYPTIPRAAERFRICKR